jgi:14-3-3 protein epsilon
MSMASNAADLIYLVHVAQELGRPQDMISLMNQVLALAPHLDMEERVLFSQAYHESIQGLRTNMAVIEPYLQGNESPERVQAIQNLVDQIRSDVHALCTEVIRTTDEILVPASDNTHDHIFYNKMKGDYFRYDAEFQLGALHEEAVKNAGVSYETALNLAQDLDIINPVRLGLILNYCVFLVDVKGDKENGRNIAKTTMEDAESKIREAQAEGQDADICLKLLRDNMRLWKEEDEQHTLETKE